MLKNLFLIYYLFEFNKINNKSAENYEGFSETTHELSNLNKEDDYNFYNWLAGVIDGDGNFDIIKGSHHSFVLKAIRIKLHNRDIYILTRILDYLGFGRIKSINNKPYSMYIVSRKEHMKYLINRLNGLIRIKVPGFEKACIIYNIDYKEPNYNIKSFDPYLSGLIDTDGSIVFNYNGNRIECNLEFKYNDYTKKLNFDNTIPFYKPNIMCRIQNNEKISKKYTSIRFSYQTVNGMIYLYKYFMKNRLYSDFKYFRIKKIEEFLSIRKYKSEPRDSKEFKIYSDFLLNWIQYKNPSWSKIPFVKKIR